MNNDIFAKFIAACGIIISQESALSADLLQNDDCARAGSVISVDTSDYTRCDEWNAGCNSCSG